MDKLISELIRKYALQNAVRYNGKATPGAVIPKIIGEDSTIKDKLKELIPEISKIISEVNSMNPEAQKEELEKTAPELLEIKQKKREGLKELPNVKGKVIMRIAPSPSGPMHIGHAYIASLNYEYVKKYGGEFHLRIEDTNPDNIYEPAYEMIPEDLNWLCEGNVSKIIIQSSRIQKYYKYAEKLINQGNIYICDCNPDEFKTLIENSQACPCRELSSEIQMERWKKMLNRNGYEQGTAVVRFKSELNHKNPAMRDFPLLRINEAFHPKTKNKYRVWPLMNFSVSIDDMEFGTTHALRGKDHADNAKRQEMIHNALGCKTPTPISVGRINFEGFEVSCSSTRKKINEGKYNGWDDIRIPFIPALRRKGYQPEAFRKYAIDVGISQNDKSVELLQFFKQINAMNKDIIDSKSNRYFFIEEPVQIQITGAPEQDIELDLHPEHKKGGRKFKTHEAFFITRGDFEVFEEGKLYRLMDCLNFTCEGGEFKFHSLKYEEYKEKGSSIIHWLPASPENIETEVVIGDGNDIVYTKGIGEETIKKINEEEIVQLERFGFARLDKKTDSKLIFWFAHR